MQGQARPGDGRRRLASYEPTHFSFFLFFFLSFPFSLPLPPPLPPKGAGERNFHVLYYLFDSAEKERLHLTTPADFDALGGRLCTARGDAACGAPQPLQALLHLRF